MINSPGGIQAGGSVTVQGVLPQPDRVLNPKDVVTALAILRRGQKGTSIFFLTFPTSAWQHEGEIARFTTALRRVFHEGGWQDYLEQNLNMGSVNLIYDGGISHGEGIGCSRPTKSTQETVLAEQALAALGYPCSHPSVAGPALFQGGSTSFALYVSIGSRIKPEE